MTLLPRSFLKARLTLHLSRLISKKFDDKVRVLANPILLTHDLCLYIPVQNLTRRRATLTAALLSSPSSQTLLARAKADPTPSPHIGTLEKRIEEQKRRNIQNAYRMCASATLFEAQDPDPNAVDEARIIGVRIEVFDQRKHPCYTEFLHGILSVHAHKY